MSGTRGGDPAGGHQLAGATCITPTLMPSFDLTGSGMPGRGLRMRHGQTCRWMSLDENKMREITVTACDLRDLVRNLPPQYCFNLLNHI